MHASIASIASIASTASIASIASIQMLCEGHNSRAQDYLRNQDEHALGRKAKKKINLVSEVVHFFREANRDAASLLTYPTYLPD